MKTVAACFERGVPKLTFSTDGETFSADSNADLRKEVDTIVFHDDAGQPLFVLPVLGDLVRVRVEDNEIEIEGLIRCFLRETSEDQSVKFDIRVEHGKLSGGARPLMWKRFTIDGEEQKNKAFSTTSKLEWEIDSNGNLPIVAQRVGIRAGNSSKDILGSFAAVKRPKAIPLVLQFSTTRNVPGDSALTPFRLRVGQVSNLPLLQSVDGGVSATAPTENPWVLMVAAPHERVIEAWNEHVAAPYVDALHTIRDGRPLSLLPRFTSTGGQPPWWAQFGIVDQLAPDKRVANGDVVIRAAQRPHEPKKVTLIPRSVRPSGAVREEAAFPAFVTTVISGNDPKPLEATVELSRIRSFGDDVPHLGEDDGGYAFTLLHIAGSEKAPQQVRMGALDLTFPPAGTPLENVKPLAAADNSIVRVEFRTVADEGAGDDTPGLINVPELAIRLGVLTVSPGNQDDLTGEEYAAEAEALALVDAEYDSFFRRTPSLVIATPAKPPANPTLVLDAEESAFDGNSQTVSIRLRKGGLPSGGSETAEEETNANERQPMDVLVLDTQPFLVAKVELEDLEHALFDAITDEIANWSNRAGDGGGGWELSAGATGFRLQLPPQGVGETMERRRGDFPPTIDNKIERRADFRFTPPALFALQSSYFRQRFAEAPWNLRRVLGYPGQRAAGAAIDDMQFELLYGLSVRVVNRYLRLTEIAARLGVEPGRQRPRLPWKADAPQQEIYEAYRFLWKHIFASLRSRLAILEPWDSHQDGPLELTETDGLTYELRRRARLRYPVDVPSSRIPLNIPNDPDGLAGGIAWGFESANIYNAVWRNPKSSSGQLMRPFFSALGGWGYQKASFDRNLSSIYSDTAMGRTFSISIERIGRISVTWNRAKHVIVYERTVLPSRQFFEEQDPLHGIPVLRKVREYVEVLEEERRFTDAPRERGFVTACIFPAVSKRINVNSRWGGDIGNTGWKVPLWIRNAGPADVYPKPQIFLEAAGEVEGKPSMQLIDEPEKLYFYTNTEENQPPDPNLWPPVEDVDFARATEDDVVAPKPDFGTGTPKPPDKPDELVKPSIEPFTFALAPSASPVNLVAERAAQPIGAVLYNLTLMRGPVDAQSVDPRAMLLKVLRQLTRRGVDTIVESVPELINPAALKTLCDATKEALKKLEDQWDEIKAISDLESKLSEEIHRRIETTFAEAERQIQSQLLARLNDQWASVRALIEQLRLEQEFEKGRELVEAQIRGSAEGARFALRTVNGSVGELLAVAEVAKREIASAADTAVAALDAAEEAVRREMEGGSFDPRKVEAEIVAARNVVATRLNAIEFSLSQVPRRIAGNRLDGVRASLLDFIREIDALARDLRHAVRNASTTGQQLLTAIADLRELAGGLEDEAIAVVDEFAAGVDAVVGDAEGTLRKEIDTLEGDLLKLVEDAASQPNPWDELLETTIARVTDWIDGIEDDVERHVGAIKQKLSAQVDVLLKDSLALLLPPFADLEKLTLGRIRQEAESLCKLFETIPPTRALIREELTRMFERLLRHVDELVDRVLAGLPPLSIPLPPLPNVDSLLRLVRAFGPPPKVPNLNFRLPQTDLGGIGYYFRDLAANLPLPDVRLTPVIAAVNEALEDLKDTLNPIHIELPTFSLTDRFKPDNLTNFDLSSIFPDFGGLQLGGLFSNLRLPEIANDAVKVTHGFDAQTQSGWIQAEVDVPYTEATTVFSMFGITLRLNRARFVATIRVESGAGQSPRRTFRGMISGDWDLQIGGFPLAVLVDTKLTFDDSGRIHFDVAPDRVRLQAVLAFLSDLISGLGYSDSGFSVRPLLTGVESVLDLPLPDVQAGTFGLANLRLGFTFRLAFEDGTFAIGTKFFIGSKRTPFTITVFILGGAGWVDVAFRYLPSTREFSSRVNIAILASAGLAIAFGPIKGGVYAYFGITVDYINEPNQSPRLTIGLLLLFRGEVSLLGFLSVCLSVALEALYTPGGGLIGRGSVSYSIKICWCVTINVSVGIEYKFGGGGGQKKSVSSDGTEANALSDAQAESPYETRAANYLAMFG